MIITVLFENQLPMIPVHKFSRLLHRYGVNDTWIFILMYPILAATLVYVELDFSEGLSIKTSTLIVEFLVYLGLIAGFGFYIKVLYAFFQSRSSIIFHLKSTIPGQFLFGVFTPAMIITGIEIFYKTSILHIPLEDNSVFYVELPVTATFLIVINLLYTLLYFRKYSL